MIEGYGQKRSYFRVRVVFVHPATLESPLILVCIVGDKLPGRD
jgi:hypothetical protein